MAKDNRVRRVNRQGATAVELLFETILLRGACHRAAPCADPLVALSEKSFASASCRVGLVFRGTIGCGGLATAEARPIEGQLHALGRQRRAFRTERSRIDAHP